MDHNRRLDTSYIISPTSATYDSPIAISPSSSSSHGALSPQFHLPQHARRRPHQSTLPVRLLSLGTHPSSRHHPTITNPLPQTAAAFAVTRRSSLSKS